jgi:hypothetical protein
LSSWTFAEWQRNRIAGRAGALPKAGECWKAITQRDAIFTVRHRAAVCRISISIRECNRHANFFAACKTDASAFLSLMGLGRRRERAHRRTSDEPGAGTFNTPR